MTNFQCGGYSIGISCSLLLVDLLVKENFLNSWANIHKNIISINNEHKKPVFYLPNLKKNGYYPTSIISSTPRKDCGQTIHFKVTVENANLEASEVCKSLSLLCIEETESRLGSKMGSEFYLFVKESSEAIKIEKYSKFGHAKPQLSLKTRVTCAGWDDIGANEIEFRDGNKPMHVSYWIGSTFYGLVMAIPPLNQATLGVNILVTVPNENKL